jgi:hypothetical protein
VSFGIRLVFFLFFLLVGFGVSALGWNRLYDKGGLLSAAQIGLGCLCAVFSIVFFVFG